MSDGKGHLAGWKAGLPSMAAFGMFSIVFLATNGHGKEVPLALGTLLGYGAGLFVDPDLDMRGITDSEKRMARTIILIPAVWWSAIYADIMHRIFGGHRGISHVPILGTLTRFMWFSLPVFCLLLARHVSLDIINDPPTITFGLFLLWAGCFVGLCLSDMVHILLDFIFSERGRKKRK